LQGAAGASGPEGRAGEKGEKVCGNVFQLVVLSRMTCCNQGCGAGARNRSPSQCEWLEPEPKIF